MTDADLHPRLGAPTDGTPEGASVLDRGSLELSARRTGMSFQRTRMSADRTLMSVIRTSLSLISFGFTIAQGFGKLHENGVIKSAAAPSTFGSALVMIGILLLVGGIGYHVLYMSQLRQQRTNLAEQQLIHAETVYPYSLSLMTAIVLLVLGLIAMLGLTFGVGPLG
jgi:putative membrane protein